MGEVASPVDVVVVGSGLAGMAASVHLARAGMRVLCVGPDLSGSQPVGESLDWSAPALLADLGLPMEWLIAEGVATYKKHVILRASDGATEDYVPGEWLGRAPYNVELRTMHVDRSRLNDLIREIALNHGVKMLHDRVTKVETEGKRVLSVTTWAGTRIPARWFIDASGGAASLFPRAFNLRFREYGPRKTAMWAYFTVPESIEGTTLHGTGSGAAYLDWIWEIPIHADVISVGYVAAGEAVKAMRQEGLSVEEIFRTQVGRCERFAPLLAGAEEVSPSVTAFRCRVHSGVAGPNWLVAGESASMVDPMTSNGVTAALRHASEGASLVIEYRHRRRIPWLAGAMYSRRAEGLARFFNTGIEKVIYEWPIRKRIGVLKAGDVYTVPAWSMNAIYARLRPRGVVLTMLFNGVLWGFRAGAAVFSRYCRWREVAFEVQR